MENIKHFYTNSALISTSPRDCVIEFRLTTPEHDANFKIIGEKELDSIKIYLSHQHLISLNEAITKQIEKITSSKADADKK